MKLILSGVRGNLPTTLPNTAFYGGNTSCFAVHSDAGDRIFLDAGSGLAQFGRQLPAKGVAHILLTHGHPDHTNGF
ncbi:MAG: MBL fold metallo-hydrolase, partial [Zoogloeaceae bacterium]|nr:MBL fold metallo-hydrolase [Zoogloeaceae bacterium]